MGSKYNNGATRGVGCISPHMLSLIGVFITKTKTYVACVWLYEKWCLCVGFPRQNACEFHVALSVNQAVEIHLFVTFNCVVGKTRLRKATNIGKTHIELKRLGKHFCGVVIYVGTVFCFFNSSSWLAGYTDWSCYMCATRIPCTSQTCLFIHV